MEYVIVISTILIFSSILTIVSKKKIEQNIPISIVMIVIIIYISGMFNNLKIGVTIVEILAGICLCIMINILIISERRKEILKNIVTPGLLVYIILSVILILMNKGRIFENLDEFNHWGRIIKNMFIYNTYGINEESIVIYNEYPPFTALFQYLFLSIKKVYSEDVIITAQAILYLSIIIPITKNIEWKKDLEKLLLLIPSFIIIPIIFYQNFYIEILVDGILGVIFASIIYIAYNEKDIKFKYINILTLLVMLTLTKNAGIALAILVLSIIIIELIINRKNNINTKKELKYIAIIAIIVVVFIAMWNLKTISAEKNWDFQIEETRNISFKYVINIIKGVFIYKLDITYKELSALAVFLILICSNFCVQKMANNNKYKYYSISMLISIPIYLMFIVYVYIFLLEPEETANFASHSRYCSTILLANAIFQLYTIFECDFKLKIKHIIILIAVIVPFINMEMLNTKYINKSNYVKISNNNRSVYTTFNNYYSKIEKDSKILFIATDTIMLPYIKSINEYNSNTKIANITTGNFTNEIEFEKIVQKYDYIFLYRIKDEDKEIVSNFIEKDNLQNDTLYKIIYNNENITLQRSK